MNRLPLLLVAVICPLALVHAAEQIVRDTPRAVISLGGEWQTLPIAGVEFKFPPPAEGWKPIQVPHRDAFSIKGTGPYPPTPKELLNKEGTGFARTSGMAAWFKRSFELPQHALLDRRVLLNFHGMSYRSEVWLNGKKVGRSVQAQVPIEYDVSDIVNPGRENELVVGLTDREGLVDIAHKSFIAPVNAVNPGIWGKVEVRMVPEVRVDDIFVRTYVKDKRLDLDVTVKNTGRNARKVLPEALIRDEHSQPQVDFAGEETTLQPGESRVVHLTANWLAPRLWTPETPALYYAEVSIGEVGEVLDRQSVRFGFREFEVRGYDFLLNGKRRVLFRNSYLADLGADYEPVAVGAPRSGGVREQAGRPYNCIRLHLGFDNETVLDRADEVGIMTNPESAWNWTGMFDFEHPEIWLPNVLEYYRAWVRLHRNRPSIIMWNLCNETFWGETKPQEMAVGDQILKAVRESDPTRPQEGDAEVTWGGRLPVINIHYPLSTAGALRAQYPNSNFVMPNDLYWLAKDKDKASSSWRADFKWDRPLVIGEYWDCSGDPDGHSSFMGESAYDWEKWRRQTYSGVDGQGDNEYFRALGMMTDVYRLQGVAGLNPWSGDREQVMAPIAVRPLDFHPNFFSGAPGTRKVVVFNDSGQDLYDLHLLCWLTTGGVTAWQSRINIYVGPGESKVLDVPIQFPQVSHLTSAQLTVQLKFWAAGGWHELSRHEETVFIMPKESLADMPAEGIVLLDATGQTAAALKGLGLNLQPRATLDGAALEKASVLIVGRGTDPAPAKDLIVPFVQRGGRVIILQQDNWTPLISELPEADDKHVSTRSWKRSYDHPVTEGFWDRQFSYWQPDHLVSLKTFNKPAVGNTRCLLDCGGLYGLRWSPLVEAPYGKGTFMLSQLNLVDRVEVEPMAGRLLGNMLRYSLAFQPQTRLPLRVLAGTNADLKATLAACDVITSEGLGGQGPVLVDASAALTAADVEALKAHLAGGGKVWLHGFSTETVGKVAALLPFKPEMAAYDPTVQAAARRSDDPLVNNLSSYDFHWTRIELGARKDYFEAGQPTAKLGGQVLRLPPGAAGAQLLEPALLTEVWVGRGRILFDTLLWEQALGAETDKVSRIVCSLAGGLGAEVRLPTQAAAYEYFHVDLSKFANMGYYDEVAGDGKGGWTDQGPNDMRYFLINHTGKVGGMEVATGEFPAVARLADRPFALVDPKKNGGKAVITLRGGPHCPTLPDKVTGIPVNKRADRLWFLHAACWAVELNVHQDVARYVISYEDGSKVEFPIRYGLEVSDWWNPPPVSRAKVAWTGRNDMQSPIGIYATEWQNPHPEKAIATVDLIGNLTQTQMVLVAITGGVEQGAQTGMQLLTDWKLADFKDGAVPNQVAGAGALGLGWKSPMPALATLNGHTGVRFKAGEALSGDAKQVPGLADGKPFLFEATIIPEDIPPGYYGGIYECMSYEKAGFRLCLNQQLKPVVEAFTPTTRNFLVGKTPLTKGRSYKIGVKFDGTRGYLLVNDKLDDCREAPIPAPQRDLFGIGRASGKDYYFQGIIEEIKVFAIKATG